MLRYLRTALLCLLTLFSLTQAASPTDYSLILTYFNGANNSKLYVAGSNDGYGWTLLAKIPMSFVGEWKIFRDPSFIQDTHGTFHLVWTTGGNNLGYARSQDLLVWSDFKAIQIDKGILAGDNGFTWAPELFHDSLSGEYRVVFSTATTKFVEGETMGDFRSYAIKTTDFESFGEPFRMQPDLKDTFEIDGSLIRYNQRYYYFTKFEDIDISTQQKNKRGIHYRSAPSLAGPWSAFSAEKLPGNNNNSEGPSPLELDDGSLIVYYDLTGQLMAARTTDIESGVWSDVSSQLTPPEDFRHGTVRRVRWGATPSSRHSSLPATQRTGGNTTVHIQPAVRVTTPQGSVTLSGRELTVTMKKLSKRQALGTLLQP